MFRSEDVRKVVVNAQNRQFRSPIFVEGPNFERAFANVAYFQTLWRNSVLFTLSDELTEVR